jgi:hypothetical protein
MYSVANTGIATERNVAGGIAPQGGIKFTSPAVLPSGGTNAATFYTNGNVVSHWYITSGTTEGGAQNNTSAVFTGGTLDGTPGAGIAATVNAFTGSYTHTTASAGAYYLTLYYKYGANSEYKSIAQVLVGGIALTVDSGIILVDTSIYTADRVGV